MFTSDLAEPLAILARVIALLVAIAVHEYAHALSADRLGDPTPRQVGRLTLNPFRHLSLPGTIFLFLFRFGWSQPVPVNAFNFRRPQRDVLLVSFAGPFANLLTAVVAGSLLRFVPTGTHLPILLTEIVALNLVLMIFNLLPIPPLDGASVLPFFLSRYGNALQFLQQHGFLILLGLIAFDAVSGGKFLGILLGVPVAVLFHAVTGGRDFF